MININAEDAAQVRAILLTHAELQDARLLKTMEVLSRLKAIEDDSDELIATIAEMTATISFVEEDSDNLKRIAELFE